MKLYFTTSWDDGSIYDIKLSELLNKYGIKGTFYLPIINKQVSRSLATNDMQNINKYFEVGGHTYSHAVLTEISLIEAQQQIAKGKMALEDALGEKVSSFCFPKGKYNVNLVNVINDCGFLFARTTNNFRNRKILEVNKSLMHVSLQAYPHNLLGYGISVLKGNWEGFINCLKTARNLNSWQLLSKNLFDYAYKTNGVYHLWGHSWEIEKYRLWDMLEEFLQYAASHTDIVFCTNTELWNFLVNNDHE